MTLIRPLLPSHLFLLALFCYLLSVGVMRTVKAPKLIWNKSKQVMQPQLEEQ